MGSIGGRHNDMSTSNRSKLKVDKGTERDFFSARYVWARMVGL